MRRSGEDLIFTADEAEPLQTILSEYTPAASDNLTAADKRLLNNLREEAGDLALLKHLSSIPAARGSSTGIGPKAAYVALAAVHFDEWGRLPAVTEDTTEISANNRDGALSTMFTWAAQHLVEGSATVEETREKVLRSDYEDGAMSRALGSTNEGMADRIVQSMVRAGELASWWNLQLAAEEA